MAYFIMTGKVHPTLMFSTGWVYSDFILLLQFRREKMNWRLSQEAGSQGIAREYETRQGTWHCKLWRGKVRL
jgi:hypothetical protein